MYRQSQLNQQCDSASPVRVFVAGAVRDAVSVDASPGAVAVRGGEIIDAGEVEQVLASAGDEAQRIDLPDRLIIPALVNAHAHLDLSDIGFRTYEGSFIEWVKTVIAVRAKEPAAIRAAVRKGVAMSRAAGVLTVGDIAGSIEAVAALAESAMRGVSFIELLGLDEGSVEHLQRISAAVKVPELAGSHVRPGIQPHAPYSTGPFIYVPAERLAKHLGVPLSTHLAETPEEAQFVAEASGPFRELLEAMGKWDDRLLDHYGHGYNPVDWLAQHIRGPILLAHCNYVGDAQIELMAARNWSVAYCPRASEYFGHQDHRYRDMVDAGVNVCLGTDSILCHGTLSIFDEMRRLYQRDRTEPQTLLKMATTNGLRGLQMDPLDASLSPGSSTGLIAIRYDARSGVDGLEQVLGRDAAPEMEVITGAEEHGPRAVAKRSDA